MKKIGWMAAAGLLALTAGAETGITIGPAPAIPVNRRVFGNNQLAYQNAGNTATGGNHNSYDKGYGVWDPVKDAPVPEMAGFARSAGMTVQRFPGGCGTHFFDWKKAVGTPAERPNQRFALPEFLRFCEATGAEPVITLADYAGTAAEAAELVEYLNAPDDGRHPWAARRAADGRKEPWNVVWFECGNETYHGNHRKGAESRTMPSQEYAARYREFRRAMRAVDPKVRLGAVWHRGEWNRVLLEQAGAEIDFFIPHIYVGGYSGNDGNPPPETLFRIMFGGVRMVSEMLKEFRQELEAAGMPGGKPLAVTEFNCHFGQEKPAPYRLSLGGALICAEILRQFLYNPDVLMANYWQFANEYWGMIRGYEAPYRERPAYRMQKLFHRYLLDELLTPEVAAPLFDAPGGYGVPKAAGKATRAGEGEHSANLLPVQKWRFLDGGLSGKVEQHEHADGTLEVVFRDGSDINYYHAAKLMPAYPLYGYRVTAEVRTEGLENATGAALQIGDGRGFNATRSCAGTEGVKSAEWQTVSAVYTPLVDTDSLIIQARRMAGGSPGRMFIRNVRVTQTLPENLGASPLVEATVSRSKDGRKLAFVLINKSLDAAEPVTLAIPAAAKAKAETLTGPSVAATNEDDPECVAVRPLAVELRKEAVTLQLPPCSLTGVEVEL